MPFANPPRYLWLVLRTMISLVLVTGCAVSGTATVGRGPAMVVEREPPAPRIENHIERPGYVWIKGRWDWNRAWIWVDGRWERARSGHVWRDGRWERRGQRWYWIEGQWVVGVGEPVPDPLADSALADDPDYPQPPAARSEEAGPPRAGSIWIGGRWRWVNKQWEWVPGRWEPERPRHVFVPGHWQRQGRRWVWIEGSWR